MGRKPSGRPRGRPRKPSAEALTARLNVRLSPDFARAVRDAAQAQGIDTHELCRRALLAYLGNDAPKQTPIVTKPITPDGGHKARKRIEYGASVKYQGQVWCVTDRWEGSNAVTLRRGELVHWSVPTSDVEAV